MQNIQLDLFGEICIENPLKGKRVCLSGSFSMSTKEMNAKLKKLGVTAIERVSESKVYKEGETVAPAKESTDYFVIGTNANEETVKRYELNAHDGFKARMITESKLYEFMAGTFTEEDTMMGKACKNLDLDYSYYSWTPPTINGKEFVSRKKSPMDFEDKNGYNLLIGKEVYVPEMDGVNTAVLRQICGNAGFYANTYFDDNTDCIMLSDDTIEKWKQGIKDNTIKAIEEDYNKSDSKIFNVCFTCLSEFIAWGKRRAERNEDKLTLDLINQIYQY